MVQRDGQQWLVALDAVTGKELWATSLAPQYMNGMGNGPRGTPAIADNRVFAYTGEGILVAAQLADGKLLWSRNAVTSLKGKVAEYGMACSPLVLGKQVVVSVGAPSAAIAAFDAATGELAWKAGQDAAGYSSPAVLDVAGEKQIVAFTGGSAIGVAPTGKLLWRYEFETNFECNIATPISVGANLFISSGENHGSVLLDVKAAGGKFEVGEAWSSLGPKSVLRAEWQTPILLDGHLYGFDNVGGAGPVTHLTCVDAKTGERKWQVPRWGKGNAIAADGKLFISTMKGELVVARATAKEYQEIGRVALFETTRQAPALAGGRLYLRDDQEILCVDVRATK
ncbi:MAG TPA: PQQ-like beta-propeller repeat protein, partial [Pirellulaceae bacterium]|nr:PQQ-like beta-propeller repeat protein [Pirellulaceae bacterium]